MRPNWLGLHQSSIKLVETSLNEGKVVSVAFSSLSNRYLFLFIEALLYLVRSNVLWEKAFIRLDNHKLHYTAQYKVMMRKRALICPLLGRACRLWCRPNVIRTLCTLYQLYSTMYTVSSTLSTMDTVYSTVQ